MASVKQLNYAFTLLRDISIKEGEKYKLLINTQRKEEKHIVNQTNSFCPLDQTVDLTVTPAEIQKALKDGYGDAAILKALMCVNNATVALPKSLGLGHNIKIRQYITQLQQIGPESVEGYAMTADIKQKGKNLFVVKSPRTITPQSRQNTIHEYFIGAFGTNQLRSYIPNFVYSLGVFQCSPPYLDNASFSEQSLEDKNIAVTYCQNNDSSNQTNYLMFENVVDSVSFKDFIRNGCTLEQYLNILTQLMFSLDVAYRIVDFTHYDLHTDNVLIRELPNEIYIPYPMNDTGHVIYVKTKYVATIIDMGRSHIKYKGKHFGYEQLISGTYPDKSYPAWDISKILFWSLYHAVFGPNPLANYAGLTDTQIINNGMASNPEVFYWAKEMTGYFVKDLPQDENGRIANVADYLIQTNKYKYAFPYYSEYDVRPGKFATDIIFKLYSPIVSNFITSTKPQSLEDVYGCASKGVCNTLQTALQKYTTSDMEYLEDPYVFYESIIESDIGIGLKKQYKSGLLQYGKKNFIKYMEKLVSEARIIRNNFTEYVKGLEMMSISDTPALQRFTMEFQTIYRTYINKSIKAIDMLTELHQNRIVVEKLLKLYPDLALKQMYEYPFRYIEIPERFYVSSTNTDLYIQKFLNGVNSDVAFIEKLNKPYILRTYPAASWMYVKLPIIKNAVSKIF